MKKYRLLNFGIKVNRELEEYEKSHICHKAADILRRKYPYLSWDYLKILTDLFNTKMYVVVDKNEVSLVNYIYQNKAIYFSDKKNLRKVDEQVIHECIHKLQDKRSKHGRLMQLGNCEFTLSKVKGLAFNEAAVQYIVSELFDKDYKEIDVNTIKLKLPNKPYYSVITNLMKQIMILTGQNELLVKSTLQANNDFNYKMIDYFGEKEFYEIRDRFDKIAELQIKNSREILKEKYLYLQNFIAESFFRRELKYVDSMSEIDNLKMKLNECFNFIENSAQSKEYNETYRILLGAILYKEDEIKNKYALTVIKGGNIKKIFGRIKSIIGLGSSNEY